jgi:hypothetical protein
MKTDVLQHQVVLKFYSDGQELPKKFGNFDTIADRSVQPVVLNDLASDIGIKVMDKNNRNKFNDRLYHVNWM